MTELARRTLRVYAMNHDFPVDMKLWTPNDYKLFFELYWKAAGKLEGLHKFRSSLLECARPLEGLHEMALNDAIELAEIACQEVIEMTKELVRVNGALGHTLLREGPPR